jgi:hypothetical protein
MINFNKVLSLLSLGLIIQSLGCKAETNLYVAGDIADCRIESFEKTDAFKTAALVKTHLQNDPKAQVVTLGDNVYQNGTATEFAECYGNTWGQFKDKTLPLPGNHDYNTKDAVPYYNYFGKQAGPDQLGYYSINFEKWHFLSLNSNLTGEAQQKQIDWVKRDLADHKNMCTFAGWHHPVLSSGMHGNNNLMAPFWNILQSSGTLLVLSGHEHNYERFSPQDADGTSNTFNGLTEIIVGTGGVKLRPFGKPMHNSVFSDNSSHGVLHLMLQDEQLEWQFESIDGGTNHDHGVLACHSSN